MLSSLQIRLEGFVQGVGFRPMVYRLATQHNLAGFVQNTKFGVTIHVEGKEDSLKSFAKILDFKAKDARFNISSIHSTDSIKLESFSIEESSNSNQSFTAIPLDSVPCSKCLEEFHDPKSRRFEYPFISCAECGPRFAILKSLPFDRVHTSYSNFPKCEGCSDEYHNPNDRRFHAQTLSCDTCGPDLILKANDGNIIKNDKNAIEIATKHLLSGKILAVKTLTGFQLVGIANQGSIEKIRKIKHRPKKPLVLMVQNTDQAKKIIQSFSDIEEKLQAPYGPIVIAPKKTGSKIPHNIAFDNPNLGVMLPSNGIYHLIFKRLPEGISLVVTSANRPENPIITKTKDLINDFGTSIDFILDHTLEIMHGIDDSIVRMEQELAIPIRLARGLSPKFLETCNMTSESSNETIIAFGANEKNTLALSIGKKAFVSPHIGNMDSLGNLDKAQKFIAFIKNNSQFKREFCTHDLHPNYGSTNLAQELYKSGIAIEHHKAHIGSVLAEHPKVQLEDCLFASFDGTGIGPQNQLFGGEIYVNSNDDIQRIGSLKPFPIVNGDQTVKAPWRSAIALLFEHFGKNFETQIPKHLQNFYEKSKKLRYKNLLEFAPKTSSMGRFFDGIAALLGLVSTSSYEAEAPSILEGEAGFYSGKMEPITNALKWQEKDDFLYLNYDRYLALITDSKNRPLDTTYLAALLFNSIAMSLVELARQKQKSSIVISGGCFQNIYLVKRLEEHCRDFDIKLLRNTSTPPNDAGISVGQIYWASKKLKLAMEKSECV